MAYSYSNYKAVIDSFHVETNPTYQPTSSATYCNYYAQDVMETLGTPLPSGRCVDMLASLRAGYGDWKKVGVSEAQAGAIAGRSTIAITSDHIAVIYPHTGIFATSVGQMYMSMAGYHCYNDEQMVWDWTEDRWNEIEFYASFENTSSDTFVSDTTTPVTIQRGGKYQAKITSSTFPDVVAGTAGIVNITLASVSGNDYFFAFNGVTAGSTGIYINRSPSTVFICNVVN